MKKFAINLILIFQLFLVLAAQAQTDTLLNRYREYLFRSNKPEPDTAKYWAGMLNEQGQWPDIDYNNKQLAGWKTVQHLVRVEQMALAWADPKSSAYHNAALLKKTNAALDHWLEKRYQNANWWHNEIGVPRDMRDIIILLKDELSPVRLQKALKVMAQLSVRDDFVGGNLIWCADLGLHYGALTNDTALVRRCQNLIIKEIKIGTGEGIQPDFSFHQHGKRLQMYQYGKAFLWESMRVAWQLRGTSLAFPEEKINILTDLVTKGWQWMARGVNTVPGTMDRSSSRKGELRSADIRPLIPFMIELQPEKADEFRKIAVIQNSRGALKGFRYYPYSDFAAFHRPGFSFFLKTISARTYPTESINSENLKGKLLNSGDAYLIRNGKEYFNLLPVWDWTKLPGVTAFKDAQQIDQKPFTGGVSDGISGASAMDYVLQDKTKKQTLSARKFWACHQDEVICLISDIKAEGISGEIYTALDQCRWQGKVTVNKPGHVLQDGQYKMDSVKWIHHAGFAYLPLQPFSVELTLTKVSGSWTSINASETPAVITDKVFMPVLVHHPRKENSAAYAMALCKTPKQAQKLARNPDWKIVRNDKTCQAVQFKDGELMAVFYSPARLETGKGHDIKVDNSCMVLLKAGKLYASDPSHEGKTVHLTRKNQTFTLVLPNDGTTIVQSISHNSQPSTRN